MIKLYLVELNDDPKSQPLMLKEWLSGYEIKFRHRRNQPLWKYFNLNKTTVIIKFLKCKCRDIKWRYLCSHGCGWEISDLRQWMEVKVINMKEWRGSDETDERARNTGLRRLNSIAVGIPYGQSNSYT